MNDMVKNIILWVVIAVDAVIGVFWTDAVVDCCLGLFYEADARWWRGR